MEQKFIIREIRNFKRIGGKFQRNRRIIIAVKDLKSGIEYGHPITEFIHKKFHTESLSLNNEKGPADVIVQFLNYILSRVEEEDPLFIELKNEGLFGLRNKHAELYLEYCDEELGNKRKTVERKATYLTNFYNFLWDENIVRVNPDIKTKTKTVKINGDVKEVTVLQTPFVYTKPKAEFQVIKKRKDFLTQSDEFSEDRRIKRLNLSREFIYIATIMFPDIALAVAFQFYGGLRAGETMNLTVGSCKPQGGFKYAEGGLILEIRDRQRLLFPHLKETTMNQVKRERDQAVLIDPVLLYTYKKHIKSLEKIERPGKNNSLFINSNFKPMSTTTFYTRFNELKTFYLGMLSNTPGRYKDFKDFYNARWKTQIGRGAFTNLCIDAGFSPIQTAILRGDKSPNSMFEYTDIVIATYNISKAVGFLSEGNIEFGDDNVEFIKTWKDVVHFGKTR